MITMPAICRFRKWGYAVTAKVKIAPMAMKVSQLAVLICHSSDEGFRAEGGQGSAWIRGGQRASHPPVRHRVRGAQLTAEPRALTRGGWCGIGMAWVRGNYHRRAVESIWLQRWLCQVRPLH
jgi:hypothetical protein